MKQLFPSLVVPALAAALALVPRLAPAQQSLTWEQVKAKIENANPTLRTDAINVQEMKAQEITAFLRPNPQVGLSSDGFQIAPHNTPGLGERWQPLTGTQLVPSINYLHERQRKRELRLESVNIPIRAFDHNQGEKQRTQLDIGRNKEVTEAVRSQVFSDVDSAYAQVSSNLALLRPYKEKYLAQATRVRETVTYLYKHCGASLMDLPNARSDYRIQQLACLQLIGSYLTAAGQLNLAVGREVIQ
jgi:hypothetical protein